MTPTNKIWEFQNNGRILAINTPNTPTEWTNYLFNDTYLTEVSQTLQGSSSMIDEYKRTVYTKGQRYFYVRNHNTGEIFCPTTQPYPSQPDHYLCEHGLHYTKLTAKQYGITFSAKIFVPKTAPCEIWEISLTNCTGKAAEISVFSAVPFENNGPMGGECRYEDGFIYKYSFPYHVFYDDKKKVENKRAYSFMYADEQIASYDGSAQRFFGCANRNIIPAAVQRGWCSSTDFEGDSDSFMAAAQHRFQLNADETKTFHIIIGTAVNKEEIRSFISKLDVTAEWEKVDAHWKNYERAVMIETPNKILDAMVNFWVKKQVILLTELNRMSTYCPVRNQLQDALGYAVIQPRKALEYALRVLRRQQYNGFLKQWYMTDGSPDEKLCLIKHSDAPVWLIICLIEIINQCEDASIYDQKECFIDNNTAESVYCHLVKAAEYLGGALGAHGLCLMLDGDWTDPINGAGRLGRGESTWLSMAAVYAFGLMMEICEYKGDAQTYQKLADIRQRLTDAINKHCWCGKWYVCGFDDNGAAFGTAGDEEGELFLNAQTWALISGVAKGERKQAVINAIHSLETEFGSLLLKPAFRGWNDTWGRISIKQAGTTENGSVYCHASMFKAYADCLTGNAADAYQTILHTLPTNPQNPPEHNLQCPNFIPNYYFGLPDSPNYGISSCNYGTGSAAWFLWVVIRHILGVKRGINGTKIQPALPKGWNNCYITLNGKEKFRISAAAHNVLFVGNSLLLGMFGKYGMCSSSPKKDYAYYVQQEIKKYNKNCVFSKLSGGNFENAESMDEFEAWFSTDANAYTNKPAKESFTENLDLIFLQLADNVNTDKKIVNFNKTAELLIERIQKLSPNARIIWIHGWYNKKNTYDTITELCTRHQLERVDISDIRTKENEAYEGQVCENAAGEKEIVKEAWITHPGDSGMKKIADKIIHQLRYPLI